MNFTPCDPREEPAATLIAAMVDELVTMYRIDRGRPGMPVEPAEMAPPVGVYLVGRSDTGEVVAGGGLRTLAPGVGEVKRMYVVPEWRGRGIARSLLGALELESRRLGHRVVRLDTGPRQAGARHIYETSGYRSVPDYNGNPHAAFWGEKQLAGPDV